MNSDVEPIVVTVERDTCPSCEGAWDFDATPICDKLPMEDGYVHVSVRIVAFELTCRQCGDHRYTIDGFAPVVVAREAWRPVLQLHRVEKG